MDANQTEPRRAVPRKGGEAAREATHKKSLSVRREGTRQVKRNLDFYNLDRIISVGYRVKSHVATPSLGAPSTSSALFVPRALEKSRKDDGPRRGFPRNRVSLNRSPGEGEEPSWCSALPGRASQERAGGENWFVGGWEMWVHIVAPETAL